MDLTMDIKNAINLANFTQILFDDIGGGNPWQEIEAPFQRVPHNGFSTAGSLQGRIVCVWKLCYHTLAIILKPAFYIAFGVMGLVSEIFLKLNQADNHDQVRFDFSDIKLILSGLVAPFGQILMVFKSILGIIHPGFYFKENKIENYFQQLVAIAQELECENDLIELLENGSSIICLSLQFSGLRQYYETLIQRDLDFICEKLKSDDLDPEDKISILQIFDGLWSNDDNQSIACAPGMARLFESICSCLNVPQNPKKVTKWLVEQYQKDIVNQLVLQIMENEERLNGLESEDEKRAKKDVTHFENAVIRILNKEIELPQDIIIRSFQDSMADKVCLSDREEEEIITKFYEIYTEETLESYLLQHINSQPDGRPGLKKFRLYMIQQLSEQISESEIAKSKQEIMDRLKIGEALADDPIFYVKLHYHADPDIDPSDEKASDLNIEGIRAFTAILKDQDPFAAYLN